MLSDSEKIDLLKYISKTHRNIHEARIKRELHVVIAALSFYTAVVAFNFSGRSPKGCIISIVASVAFIIIAVGVFIYMECSKRANDINQRIAEEAEKKLAYGCLEINEILDEINKKHPMRSMWSYKAITKIPSKLSGLMEIEEYHPCANRWLLQSGIVFLGAIIAILLIIV